MKSLRAAIALLTLLALLVLVPGRPAWSATQSTATCFGTWHVSFSPGIGLSSSEVAFATRDDMGAITCLGDVRGHVVNGPATMAQTGVIDGTCLEGTGSGTASVTVATPEGPQVLSFPFTMTYGAGVGFKHSASLVGAYVFLFAPSAGTCLTSPVTDIAAVGQFALKS